MGSVFDFEAEMKLALKRNGDISQLAENVWMFRTDGDQLLTPPRERAVALLLLRPNAFAAPTMEERLDLLKGQWLYEERILKTYYRHGLPVEYTWKVVVGGELVGVPVLKPFWLTN